MVNFEPDNAQGDVSMSRPFVLERAGGTRIFLSTGELRQRWSEKSFIASDRVVDRRSGRQFPAISLHLFLDRDTAFREDTR